MPDQTVVEQLHELLHKAFDPSLLVIENQSAQHAGHMEAGDGGDTHFHLIIASKKLDAKSRIMQHRTIFEAVSSLLDAPIHALSIEVKPSSN